MKSLIIGITLFLMAVSTAQAQESLAEQSPRLTQLTQDYLFQASEYQKAKQEFDLSKAEYKQLQTLVSREKVVSTFKTMAKYRAATQLAYLSAIEQVLAETPGVDPAEKNKVLDLLSQSRSLLIAHEFELAPILSPEDINLKAAEIVETMATVYKTQYAILSLIALSRNQFVYDQLISLTNQFEETNVTLQQNSSLKNFLNRGLTDVRLQNSKASDALDKAKQTYNGFYAELKKNEKLEPSRLYSSVVRDLTPIQGYANQSISYLRELERQVLRQDG